MLRHLGTSLRITIVSIVLLGLIYPLAMTGVAQASSRSRPTARSSP